MIHYFLRVILMGDDFFLNLDSTFMSFASNIAVISAWFLLIFEYVVAETIGYLNISPHFFYQMSSWSVDDDHQHHHEHHHRHHHYYQDHHHHDHHHDHHCLHVYITSPFFNVVNIELKMSMNIGIEDRPPNSSPWRIKFLVIKVMFWRRFRKVVVDHPLKGKSTLIFILKKRKKNEI